MEKLIERIRVIDYLESNKVIETICGIVDCFSSEQEKDEFISYCASNTGIVSEDRVSYGDWQTPIRLAADVCRRHLDRFGSPDVMIEPTCGIGNFVMSALEVFPSISELYCIEINSEYTNTLKCRILTKFLQNNNANRAKIHIVTANVFDYDFISVFKKARQNHQKVGVIGNPPWVTSSTLGQKKSNNTPNKHNKFSLKGIEAVTGKSNFDISEALCIDLFQEAYGIEGGVSMLLKNSVVRNLVNKQHRSPMAISEIEQLNIDATKEFDVSVDACCMQALLSEDSGEVCKVKNFYDMSVSFNYGWDGDSFVSNLNAYNECKPFDGKSRYVWRSGIKHDCSAILELKRMDDGYVNGKGEVIELEQDFIYPLVKSSDVGKFDGVATRKFLLLPQRYIGENTNYLYNELPLTYQYLINHIESFRNRKSSIYKGKSDFSVFGLGDYSFKKYKIAISSFYKEIKFMLINPIDGKPVMLDDTCYFIGFDHREEAERILQLLNSREVKTLLQSLVFSDSKRVVTKDLLMRIDIDAVAGHKHIELDHNNQAQVACQLSLFD